MRALITDLWGRLAESQGNQRSFSESPPCSQCGHVAPDDDSYWGEDDEPLCESCWRDEQFVCCKCDEYEWVSQQGRIGGLVVVADDDSGVPVGVYEVTEHPYYTAGLIGSSWLHDWALKRIGDVPNGVDTDGYPVGHLCRGCEKKIRKHNGLPKVQP
jgi:hypothetical protein